MKSLLEWNQTLLPWGVSLVCQIRHPVDVLLLVVDRYLQLTWGVTNCDCWSACSCLGQMTVMVRYWSFFQTWTKGQSTVLKRYLACTYELCVYYFTLVICGPRMWPPLHSSLVQLALTGLVVHHSHVATIVLLCFGWKPCVALRRFLYCHMHLHIANCCTSCWRQVKGNIKWNQTIHEWEYCACVLC